MDNEIESTSNEAKGEYKTQIEKLESLIHKLEAQRDEERIRNDLKLDKEIKELKRELQEENSLIMKGMQRIKETKDKNLTKLKQKEEEFKKEKEDERNRIIKESQEEKVRSIALIENMYQTRIQKMEADREEERVRNDLKLEVERKVLEEERKRYIKLEAKLEDRESQFEKERREHKIEILEKDSKYESERKELRDKFECERDNLIKLVLVSPTHKSKKINNKDVVNKSPLTSNSNILAINDDYCDDESNINEEGAEEVTANLNTPQVKKADWTTLIRTFSILKLKCFLVSLFLSTCTFLLMVPLVLKDYGLIHVVTNVLDSNLFFVTLVAGRFTLYIASYLLTTRTLYDIESIIFFTFTAFCWLLASLASRFAFPSLTGRYFDENNIESSAPSISKVEIILLLIMTNAVSQVFGNVTLKTFYMYFKKDWIMNEMKNDEQKRNFKYIFCTLSKMEITVNLAFWSFFSLIIGIVSVEYVPNLDQNLEILFFGYFFPLVKASVVSVMSYFIGWYSKLNGWSPEFTAKMASSFSAAAVQICTLPQLYWVFHGASDPSFFLYQFVPHEIIKKLSWLTFHPLYLKMKLQIWDILNKSYKSLCTKKDKVNPGEKITEIRRFTIQVFDSLAAVGGDVFGREFGEEICMILITFYMLPICQQYLFPQIYQSTSSSLPFPGYQSIGVMIIGVAFTLETALTIICFAALEREGIPIISNSQAIEPQMQTYLCFLFTSVTWIIILTATTVY